MRVVVGIPARMGSTRFPGKPLCTIHGVPMVQHCVQRSALSEVTTEVFVAACDAEVETAVKGFNGNVILTDPKISRPGLRVAAAATQLDLSDDDIVVVVQGDEPLVHPAMIDEAVRPLMQNADVLVSNLCAPITETEWQDPNEVKVVCDLSMNATYMSRAPIPSVYHEERRAAWWKQVCIMPFRWSFMKAFNYQLAETPLELQESIEMLRAIQHGYKVRMVPTGYISKSVDCEADREQVERLMSSDEIFQKHFGDGGYIV